MLTLTEIAELQLSADLEKEKVFRLISLFRKKQYLPLDELEPDLRETALSLSEKGILYREGNLLSRDRQAILELFSKL